MLTIRNEQMRALEEHRLQVFLSHVRKRLQSMPGPDERAAEDGRVDLFLNWALKTATQYGIESEIHTARFAEIMWPQWKSTEEALPKPVRLILYDRSLTLDEKLERVSQWCKDQRDSHIGTNPLG